MKNLIILGGAQCLSGGVLDLRLRVAGSRLIGVTVFCPLLSTGLSQEDLNMTEIC